MPSDHENSRRGLLLRSTFSLAGMFVVFGVLQFLPAGIGWRKGWLFLLVFLGFMILSSIYLWRANPDIFIARSKIHQGTKSWDKVLVSLILVSFFAIFPTAGFDARWHGSAVPLWLITVGYLLFALGFVLSTWVYAVNKFAEPSVRIQSERLHTVVDTGPNSRPLTGRLPGSWSIRLSLETSCSGVRRGYAWHGRPTFQTRSRAGVDDSGNSTCTANDMVSAFENFEDTVRDHGPPGPPGNSVTECRHGLKRLRS